MNDLSEQYCSLSQPSQISRMTVSWSSGPIVRAAFAMTLLLGGTYAQRASSQQISHEMRPSTDAQSDSRLPSNYGNLPLSFEINQGQSAPNVRFLSRGSAYSLFLADSTAVLTLFHPDYTQRPSSGDVQATQQVQVRAHSLADVVQMELPGMSRDVRVSGVDPLPGVANYFIGTDPTLWHSNVPTYAKVKYEGVYPGVDLVFYGNQRQLEYDFVIAPHADATLVRMHFANQAKVRLDASGNLSVTANHGKVMFHRPIVYQIENSRRVAVEGHFRLLGKGMISFALGHYDPTRQLIIDPTLAYSTYLGGSGYHIPAGPDCCGDYGKSIAVDADGNVYVTGQTGSANFPTTKYALQTATASQRPGAPGNAFVTKLNASGTALIYSTYLGGSGDYYYGDAGQAIAVDASGAAYVAGYTGSENFPVTADAYQKTNKAYAGDAYTGFIAKLGKNGAKLEYSTYLGGSGIPSYPYGYPPGDEVQGLALGSEDTVVVAGTTFSGDFPVSEKAFQRVNNATEIGGSNLFVSKLNRKGSSLAFSTYLGGSGYSEGCCYYFSGADFGSAVAVDANDNAYVTGYAYSHDFPVTVNAYQSENRANMSINGTGAANYNVVVSKLNSTGTRLVYSTYLGGSGNVFYGDKASAIAVDKSCHAYVTGLAGSADFPVTAGAFQTVFKNDQSFNFNAFLTKFNESGSALSYSTYLGGSGGNGTFGTGDPVGDSASGVKVNSAGNAFVTGTTQSADFPVTSDALQPQNNQSANPGANYYSGNAFLTEFDTKGSALVFSTYWGGSGSVDGAGGDSATGLALDARHNVYITGHTLSSNFPVSSGAFQTASPAYAAGDGDSGNAFITKFALGTGAVSSADSSTCGTASD